MEDMNVDTLLNSDEPPEEQRELQKRFAEAKRFILLSLENTRAPNSNEPAAARQSCRLWDFLSDELKEDRDIALAAFLSGHASHQNLPARWNRDRAFLLDAVKEDSAIWYNLPDDYQRDPAFVWNFTEFYEGQTLVDAVIEKIPALGLDRMFWDKVISSSREHPDWSIETAPASIRSDRELMKKACVNNYDSLSWLDQSLALDRDFIYEVIEETGPSALFYLSYESQRMFPELLTGNLQYWIRNGQDQANILYGIAPDLITSPFFVKAWFSAGGRFLREHFDSIRDNRHIFLWIAKHASCSKDCMDWFKHASNRLKGDREFMKKAMELEPYAYFQSLQELKGDPQLLVKPLSLSTVFAVDYVFSRASAVLGGARELENVSTFLHSKVDPYEAFVTSILIGISLPADPSQCPITILNQGVETSIAYKRRIAEYVGIPMGKSLLMFQYALKNYRLAVQEEQRRFSQGDSSPSPFGPRWFEWW